ncbi:MAG TPA: hypothetical protein G4O03_03125 [Dehalococcoidia bacterium]|jgi:aldehyde:ferredoxin oxidoreductase|nr:hypothetical protein [Dehalococcoidia bacterium]
MEYKGLYMGRVLHVDLTAAKTWTKPLDPKLVADFIGGWGIDNRLAYDYVRFGADPLAPEQPIIIGCGVFNGTVAPGSSKSFATTVCPASGTVSTWVGSLTFGARLRAAGYDHMVITGRAPKPVYLKLRDDDVEICDAGELWGQKDTLDTHEWLLDKHGRAASTLCIGPAGENRVKIAIALVDKFGTMGRTMAANLGSKNLKAIVVDGSHDVRLADAKRFMRTANQLMERAMTDRNRDNWRNLALYFVFPLWENAGYFTRHNARETWPRDEVIERFGQEQYKKLRGRLLGCTSCLTCDKAIIQLKEEFPGTGVPFSTPLDPPWAFGLRCEAGSIEKAYKCGELANRYGIDMMTWSAIFDWATDLYHRGILTREDTGGFDLSRRDFGMVCRLLEMTAKREGFGDVLAQGFLGAIERIGRGSENHALHIKGTEFDFDPRANYALETFGAMTNVRPCHDMPVTGLTVAKGRDPAFFARVVPGMGFSKEAMERIFTPDGFDLGRFLAHFETWGITLNIFGLCFRMQVAALYNINTVAELYVAATGIEKSPQDILDAAERAYNLARAMNALRGFSRKDDRLPDFVFTQPIKRPDRGTELSLMNYQGTKVLTKEDVDRDLDSYYEERGWTRNGIPGKEVLARYGLGFAAEALERGGLYK